MKTLIISMCVTLFLFGCAGRDPRPVNVVQSFDTKMSCEMIRKEIQNSQRQIQGLSEEKSDKRSSNIAVGVVGAVLFLPALFALDTSNAQNVEIEAHQQRINHLGVMHSQKCLDVEPNPQLLKAASEP